MATHSSNLAWKIPGQRSLVGYSPWRGHKESDTTWQQQHQCMRECLFKASQTAQTKNYLIVVLMGISLIIS